MLNGSGIVWGNFIFVWQKNFNLKGFFQKTYPQSSYIKITIWLRLH